MKKEFSICHLALWIESWKSSPVPKRYDMYSLSRHVILNAAHLIITSDVSKVWYFL